MTDNIVGTTMAGAAPAFTGADIPGAGATAGAADMVGMAGVAVAVAARSATMGACAAASAAAVLHTVVLAAAGRDAAVSPAAAVAAVASALAAPAVGAADVAAAAAVDVAAVVAAAAGARATINRRIAKEKPGRPPGFLLLRLSTGGSLTSAYLAVLHGGLFQAAMLRPTGERIITAAFRITIPDEVRQPSESRKREDSHHQSLSFLFIAALTEGWPSRVNEKRKAAWSPMRRLLN